MEKEQLTEVLLPGVVEPEGLLLRTGPVPAPAAGQAVIRMEAAGVSFAEQQMRRGRYYDQPPFPFVPGYDLVGIVTAVGADAPRHHDSLRDLDVIPVDYHADVPTAVRKIAPEGVDAVFDHLGMRSLPASWQLLASGGTLVSYGTAATFPLARAADTLRLAESHTVAGKIVLSP